MNFESIISTFSLKWVPLELPRSIPALLVDVVIELNQASIYNDGPPS